LNHAAVEKRAETTSTQRSSARDPLSPELGLADADEPSLHGGTAVDRPAGLPGPAARCRPAILGCPVVLRRRHEFTSMRLVVQGSAGHAM
jgi:hypothetical protein